MGDFIRLMHLLNNKPTIEWTVYAPFYERYKEKVQFPKGSLFNDYSDLLPNNDLFLALGGDGTILDSLTLVRDKEIPVAGINFGRLGFLTTESVDEQNLWMDDILKKNYKVNSRTLLHVCKPGLDCCLYGAGEIYPYALNEVSIQRIEPAMLEIHVKIDGEPIPVYWADGILIATATGSTAYSLSNGGPIIVPQTSTLCLTPVAQHSLSVRPIVISDDSRVTLYVESRSHNFLAAIDGRSVTLTEGTTITISKAPFVTRIVKRNDRRYFSSLREKMMWGADYRKK